ncbi:hypothetical protein Glove_114g70 [Diversispora epigaea]|uniref:Protein kinase domain-containing protein n=1 Tax=Diversispora epigaea TaxID=1348612 RepID=A0A397J5W1_9GLOM|nr:hypothetical protein Glove_114g70 [Diversispora epigaea]
MSDNITLNCLVYCDPKKKAFEVEIEKNKSVSSFKEKIKEKLYPQFESIAAKDIVLWKVNVPFGENTMKVDIVLKNDKDTGVQELSHPTKKIGIVFTENITDDSIHVVIERLSVHDVSGKILNAFKKIPNLTLPEVDELANFLEKPIPENMKMPLSQREYDNFLNPNLDDLCTSEDLDILFQVSKTESAYKFTIKTLGWPILNNPPSEEGTKYSYVSFWDANIRFPLELLISDGKSVRNSSQHTSTFAKQPDYGFIVNHVCPFRGEEKSPINNEDAKAKLRDKLCWTYDPAPYVLGYYANGPDVTFVAICRPLRGNNPDVVNIVKSNLNQRSDRIINLRRIINLSVLIKSLQKVIGWRETPEFQPIHRDKKTITVWATNIKKTFTDETESEARVEKLKNVYFLLKKKGVPNVDDLLQAGKGAVYLGPKGMSVRPNNQKELLEAIACILEALVVMHDGDKPIFHQDIRWANIIRLPGEPSESSKWILIDWDEAEGPLTRPAIHLAKENHAPEVFQENHYGEVDMWGVGRLITEASKWIIDISPKIIEFGREMQNYNRPNARDALEKIKSFMT